MSTYCWWRNQERKFGRSGQYIAIQVQQADLFIALSIIDKYDLYNVFEFEITENVILKQTKCC